MGGTDDDAARIRALREQPSISQREREELRALRYRETIEATNRRIAFFKRAR